MKIRKLTPAIGAEISGVDLSEDLDPGVVEKIYQALINNLMIVFHDQDLSGKNHLSIAEQFGEVDKPHLIYPHVKKFPQVMLLENDGDKLPNTNDWHTDLTYYPNPPFASILHARKIPETGGDTLWASMYAAYDALPNTIKTEIADKKAIHDPGTFRNDFLGEDIDVDALNERLGSVGSAVHPMVKTHPTSGKKYLYVNRSFTCQVLGYGTQHSERLLNYLFDHINQPEFQIRHRWSQGDVVMWDNRVTQHYAVADYAPHHRRMHRVTILNDHRTL